MFVFFFFFNDTATTEIYTLSLHDALPIYSKKPASLASEENSMGNYKTSSEIKKNVNLNQSGDRKSTRLNSSHTDISRMPSSA